ncbi:hypothetical protein [Hippea maritima]|uniref:DUF3137 domain-containing protein n=1 Tax=Hippea maritima (strain ATCC 700847 / DSM 10411 / MH2) TaxID=760142 RepID=F2LXQ9_HIPMA|nr:hypothetical protein [Hippea maritima]AEA34300.1 hypothetical protein Hipma_1344 [Hippea maritima DSM 10411]
MSSAYITIFIGISVAISLVYIAGYKKNIKIMKEMAKSLESALNPKDKLYTYLGGVLGFSAEYKVDGFKKVFINLRLIPRQSILYLPFMFVTSGKDSLQIMFYTEKPIRGEFHIIKEDPLKLAKPKIYNREKLSKEISTINNKKYEILKDSNRYSNFKNLIKLFNDKHFNHLAITKENSIVYINLLFYKMNYKEFKNSLKKTADFIKSSI